MNLHGIQIRQSPLVVTFQPVKAHKHRRNQSKAYHLRVQKKWVKRFGRREVPGCWLVGGCYFVHPTIYERMRKQIG